MSVSLALASRPDMPFRNILIIKLRYVGDVLLATPVLRALKAAYPEARLTMVVNQGTEDILTHNPDVDDVLVVKKSSLVDQFLFLRDLRRRRFDCVLDLTDGDRSALLAWISGAPVRLGFNSEERWRGLLYSQIVRSRVEKEHRVDRDLAVLQPLSISAAGKVPTLVISQEDELAAERILIEVGIVEQGMRRRLVMLQPAARYWFKAWPEERFAELADRLGKECGCQVLIGGGPQDVELAERICRRTHTACAVVAGRATLLQYAALLKRCALFVGNDSGAMHIATAMGTPVVALFGPSDPREWGPCGGQADVIYKGLDCRACFHPTCQRGENNCMRLITVDEVYASAVRMMNNKEHIGGCA